MKRIHISVSDAVYDKIKYIKNKSLFIEKLIYQNLSILEKEIVLQNLQNERKKYLSELFYMQRVKKMLQKLIINETSENEIKKFLNIIEKETELISSDLFHKFKKFRNEYENIGIQKIKDDNYKIIKRKVALYSE